MLETPSAQPWQRLPALVARIVQLAAATKRLLIVEAAGAGDALVLHIAEGEGEKAAIGGPIGQVLDREETAAVVL